MQTHTIKINSNFHRTARAWSLALALLLSLTLGACGGGGGGGSSDAHVVTPSQPPASIDLTQLQGRWATVAGVPKAYVALVLPPQSGSATAWVLAQDASSLSKLAIVGTSALSATGRTYTLTGNPQAVADVSSAVTATLSATPKTLALASLGGASVNLSQTDALGTAASLSDVAANWSASAGAGTVQQRWSVAPDGKVTGTSTSGCTWAGTLTTMVGVGLYNLAASEDCQGAVVSLSGIASLSPDKTRLTVVATTTDAKSAVVLFFGK
jgi:hypothetical protein